MCSLPRQSLIADGRRDAGAVREVPRFASRGLQTTTHEGHGESIVRELPRAAYAGEGGTLSKRPSTVYAKAGAYMGLAFVIPAAMYGGYWIGGYADASLGTGYWSIVGLLLGFAGGLYEVYTQATRIEKIGKNR